jgi:phosphoribosyl-AMP cyclohydrolase
MDPLRDLDFSKAGGLVTAIAQDFATGEILMVAHMTEESLRRTRSVRELYADCDGDVVLLKVEQRGGAACHTGRRSCFFRRLEQGRWKDVGVRVFDPAKVYGS